MFVYGFVVRVNTSMLSRIRLPRELPDMEDSAKGGFNEFLSHARLLCVCFSGEGRLL